MTWYLQGEGGDWDCVTKYIYIRYILDMGKYATRGGASKKLAKKCYVICERFLNDGIFEKHHKNSTFDSNN